MLRLADILCFGLEMCCFLSDSWFFLLLYRLLYFKNKVFLYQLFGEKNDCTYTCVCVFNDDPAHMLFYVHFIRKINRLLN